MFNIFLKMKHFLPFILFFFFIQATKAQMVVDTSYSLDSLALNVFLGENVTISNVQFVGDSNQIGEFFIQGLAQPGITNGIALSSGSVSGIIGPNNQTGFSVDHLGLGDSLIDSILGTTTYDAASFEFDFIPSFDSIMFRYVFGSEEYPEFVNSAYNDAFGHFISGPGIVGEQNMALIPDTTLPVTINNLNWQSFSQYYVDNSDSTLPAFQAIQWDAFTTPLVSTLIVQPGQQYHMRIVVVDVFDGIYDSGLLLQSQSFRSLPSSSFVGKTELYANTMQFKINATQTNLNVLFNSNSIENGNLTILNELGQTIYNQAIKANKGQNRLEIPCQLANGLYLGYIQIGSLKETIKFIQH